MLLVSLLDPKEGEIYSEVVRDDIENQEIENIYNISGCKEDYVNPTDEGEINWCSICSFDLDLEEDMEIWKKILYEVSSERYTRIINSLCWVGTKLCDHIQFDGIKVVDEFINQMEEKLPWTARFQ